MTTIIVAYMCIASYTLSNYSYTTICIILLNGHSHFGRYKVFSSILTSESLRARIHLIEIHLLPLSETPSPSPCWLLGGRQWLKFSTLTLLSWSYSVFFCFFFNPGLHGQLSLRALSVTRGSILWESTDDPIQRMRTWGLRAGRTLALVQLLEQCQTRIQTTWPDSSFNNLSTVSLSSPGKDPFDNP